MPRDTMTIYLVLDMKGRFVAAFQSEEAARRYVMKQPGRFKNFDVTDVEMETFS